MTENERMKELVKLFSKKGEIYKKEETAENEPAVNEALYKSFERAKALASGKLNADFKENFNTGFAGNNQVRTVSTIADQMYNNSAVSYQPVRQPLQADEAFELSINRALKSGAPVKDMGLYDEINWHLQSLGFPAKNGLDIKGMILKMMAKDK